MPIDDKTWEYMSRAMDAQDEAERFIERELDKKDKIIARLNIEIEAEKQKSEARDQELESLMKELEELKKQIKK